MNSSLIRIGVRAAVVVAAFGIPVTGGLLFLSTREQEHVVAYVALASGISLAVGTLGRLAYWLQKFARPDIPSAKVGFWHTRSAGNEIKWIVSWVYLPLGIVAACVHAWAGFGSGPSSSWIPTLLLLGYVFATAMAIMLIGRPRPIVGIDYL